MTRQLHFFQFGNEAGDRTPYDNGEVANTVPDRLALVLKTARVLEAAKIDGFFIADSQTFGPQVAWPYSITYDFEPFTLASVISTVTNRLGLAVTATTTFEPPFTIARQTLALDHLSGGRAGLNIVTTAGEETATNYTRDGLPNHADRYRKAEEAVEIITALWDSFEDDAVLPERREGVIHDLSKIHPVDFEGEFFQVDALIGSRRSPQGRPVVIQAGSSKDGAAFAARHAEVIFSGHSDIDAAQRFYRDIHAQAEVAGRITRPLILPGLFFVTGETEEEAQRNRQVILDNIVLEVKIGGLKEIDIDLSDLDLDDPLPPFPAFSEKHQTGLEGYRKIAAEPDVVTVRDFIYKAAFSGYFHSFVGSAEQLADEIERWHASEAADGFILFPGGGTFAQTELFAQKVVPILQRRGLFRTEYSGTTLRENLGLDRPENIHRKPE